MSFPGLAQVVDVDMRSMTSTSSVKPSPTFPAITMSFLGVSPDGAVVVVESLVADHQSSIGLDI